MKKILIQNFNSQKRLTNILGKLHDSYQNYGGINNIDGINLPSNQDVVNIIKKILKLVFPGFYGTEQIHNGNLKYWSGQLLDEIYQSLRFQVAQSLYFQNQSYTEEECFQKADQLVLDILETFPAIRTMLQLDVEAAYNGDPSAYSHEEIITSFPGLQAIALHRIAHEFYIRKIKLIDRMISEYAHMATGIDIHPGAVIGKNFFIDHGTGIVIGETCKIGDHVKIYQMVTLGALSFQKDENGMLIKGIQRHPTIEDNVILYAGCTILGNIVVGKNSIIGGNVWVTKSVPSNTIITFDVEQAEYRVKQS